LVKSCVEEQEDGLGVFTKDQLKQWRDCRAGFSEGKRRQKTVFETRLTCVFNEQVNKARNPFMIRVCAIFLKANKSTSFHALTDTNISKLAIELQFGCVPSRAQTVGLLGMKARFVLFFGYCFQQIFNILPFNIVTNTTTKFVANFAFILLVLAVLMISLRHYN